MEDRQKGAVIPSKGEENFKGVGGNMVYNMRCYQKKIVK